MYCIKRQVRAYLTAVLVQLTSFSVRMLRRADRYISIAISKGYRTVKILWPTDDCSKSSRLYKWENRAIFSHFWRNLLAYSTVVLYENLPFNMRHTVNRFYFDTQYMYSCTI